MSVVAAAFLIVGLFASYAVWLRSARMAVVATWVTALAVVLLAAEILSLGTWLTPTGLDIVFFGVGLLALLSATSRVPVHLAVPDWRGWLRNPALLAWGGVSALLLVIALVAIPNTFDAMAYHLVKVDAWTERATLAPFAVHYPAQIYLPPLAELGVFALIGDGQPIQLASLVQFGAHLTTFVALTLLARGLGLGREGQLLAAAFGTLAPLAVAEAVTTQNDYVLTALVVSALALLVRAVDARGLWLTDVLALAALALAVATKPTALLWGWPVGLWLLWRRRGLGAGRVAALAGAGLLLLGLANAGWLARNVEAYGSPLGPPSTLTMSPSASGALVNLVRVGAAELGTPSPAVNDGVAGVARGGLSALGLDIDDPASIYGASAFSVDSQRNEDRPANPLQAVLGVGSVLVIATRRRLRSRFGALALVVGAGLLSCATALKWQPWEGRLLLPAVVLSGVFAAGVLDAARGRRWARPLSYAVLALAVLQSLPWVLTSTWRPVIGSPSMLVTTDRDDLFRAHPELRSPYERAAAAVAESDARVIGFGPGVYPWEYPLRRTIRQTAGDGLAFVNVGTSDASTRLAAKDPSPDAVICLCEEDLEPGWEVRQFGPVRLFLRPGL